MRRFAARVAMLCPLACLVLSQLAEPCVAQTRESTAWSADRGRLEDELTGKALADYRAGHIAFRDGDPKSALLKFTAAHEASKNPGLLWNMASCEKNLRHYAQVVQLLRKYKLDAADTMTGERRRRVDELLDMVSAYVADLTLVVAPPAAEAHMDGKLVGQAPFDRPVLVSNGERTLRVVKAGYLDHVQVLQVKGGSSMSVSVTLIEAPRGGTLSVVAGPGDTIHVDGRAVGTSSWQGDLPAGDHSVRVATTGRMPYETTVVVHDGKTESLRVNLMPIEREPPENDGGVEVWLWVTGGVAVAAGLAVAGYFVLRPDDAGDPVPGTLPPYIIELP